MGIVKCHIHSKWMRHTLVIVDSCPAATSEQNNGHPRTSLEATQHLALKGNFLVLQKENKEKTQISEVNSVWLLKLTITTMTVNMDTFENAKVRHIQHVHTHTPKIHSIQCLSVH